MARVALLGMLLVGCVQLEENYEPVQCPSADLPAALVPESSDLPQALFDPAATAFPIISIDIAREDWRIVCESGRDAAIAYNARREPDDFFASARFQLGNETLENVGVRFMGRSTITALFAPQGDEDADGALNRCLAAFEPDSVRYDPRTGRGTFAYRPSFKVDFEQFAPGRGFHGQSRFGLGGETGFRTLIDEWLPNQLAAAAGLPHVREGHAALCINGVYRGLFFVIQQDSDQAWLDDHFDGMDPAGPGALFKINPFGPQTYHSANPADYVNTDGGNPYYDPKAGTTDEDLVNLLDLFKIGNIDTYGDEDAFRTEMVGPVDVSDWLRVVAMEMVMGDIDGMFANRNNYIIVQRADGHWVPVRRDPDLSFYPWWRESDEVWHDWPGVSEARGPSLLCLRPSYSGARPNCPDGSSPLDPSNPGFDARNVRRPALSARLVHAFLPDYLDTVDDLLGSVLSADDIRDRIEKRAALIEPWIGSTGRPRLDPWGPDFFAWDYSLRGDGREVCQDGAQDTGCIDCRTEDCTLIQSTAFYMQQARVQVNGIRAGTIPSECPRDEPENPSYQDLMSCP